MVFEPPIGRFLAGRIPRHRGVTAPVTPVRRISESVWPGRSGPGSVDEVVRALSRADDPVALQQLAAAIPRVLVAEADSGSSYLDVMAGHAAMTDAAVARALAIAFARRPELSPEAFTWLAMGSTGRREAVPGSDIDGAVVFDDGLPESEYPAYRGAFADAEQVLLAAGLSSDRHGASASGPAFSASRAQWRSAAQEWVAAPSEHQGAMMISLRADARAVVGDPERADLHGLLAAVGQRPGLLRSFLIESLYPRARLHSIRDTLTGRTHHIDIKRHALLPVVNLARWVGLAVGTTALGTPQRLDSASGSTILPREQADILVDAWHVLQRLRIRSQLEQLRRTEPPTDVVSLQRFSAEDREELAEAVHGVASVQRRMNNVAAYLPADSWMDPEGG